MRPDNRFRRQTGAGSANLAAQLNNVPVTRLNFSGTLRVLVYEGKYSAKDLNITREPEQLPVPVPDEFPGNIPAEESKGAEK